MRRPLTRKKTQQAYIIARKQLAGLWHAVGKRDWQSANTDIHALADVKDVFYFFTLVTFLRYFCFFKVHK